MFVCCPWQGAWRGCGTGRILNTRRCVNKRYNALYCDSTRPDQFMCLELDDKLIACRDSPSLSPPPALSTLLPLLVGFAPQLSTSSVAFLTALRRLQRRHCRVGSTIQLQLICCDFMPSPLFLSILLLLLLLLLFYFHISLTVQCGVFNLFSK